MSRLFVPCLVLLLASRVPADDKKPAPKGETVEGKITLDGKPLPEGTITFLTKDKNAVAATAMIADDGSFKATVPVGEYKITVGPPAPKKADPKDPPKKFPVPAKFGDPSTTPLQFTVKKGMNIYDIALISK